LDGWLKILFETFNRHIFAIQDRCDVGGNPRPSNGRRDVNDATVLVFLAFLASTYRQQTTLSRLVESQDRTLQHLLRVEELILGIRPR
jgi:hypothetical protein